MPGKLRCNFCHRVIRKSTVTDNKCVCGCQVFWLTRLTIFERIAFALRIWKDSDLTLAETHNDVGGPASLIREQWRKPQGETR